MVLKSRVFIITFIILVIAFFLAVALNMDYSKQLMDNAIQKYHYYAIFVLAFISDLLEQPIPPELPAVAGYIFGLNIFGVFLTSIIASYTASIIGFFYGKYFLSHRIKKAFSEKRYKKYFALYKKHGNFALTIAALTPIPYVTFCWLSGIFHMRFRNFVIFGLLAKTIRIGFVLWFVSLVY